MPRQSTIQYGMINKVLGFGQEEESAQTSLTSLVMKPVPFLPVFPGICPFRCCIVLQHTRLVLYTRTTLSRHFNLQLANLNMSLYV